MYTNIHRVPWRLEWAPGAIATLHFTNALSLRKADMGGKHVLARKFPSMLPELLVSKKNAGKGNSMVK